MPGGERTALRTQPALILSAVLLGGVAIAFLGAFIFASQPEDAPSSSINAGLYAAPLATALAEASPAAGEKLIAEYACSACHLAGEGRIAPLFPGIADRAAERRPPLSAEQYLYESIVRPSAFLVLGYAAAMPINYADRLSPSEIGHIIAHLLSLKGDSNEGG